MTVRHGKYELIKAERCYTIRKDNTEGGYDNVAFYTSFNLALWRFAELSGNQRSLEKYIEHIENIMTTYGVK